METYIRGARPGRNTTTIGISVHRKAAVTSRPTAAFLCTGFPKALDITLKFRSGTAILRLRKFQCLSYQKIPFHRPFSAVSCTPPSAVREVWSNHLYSLSSGNISGRRSSPTSTLSDGCVSKILAASPVSRTASVETADACSSVSTPRAASNPAICRK